MALPNEEEDSRHHTQRTLEHAESAGTTGPSMAMFEVID
jgi:hypothetical protein